MYIDVWCIYIICFYPFAGLVHQMIVMFKGPNVRQKVVGIPLEPSGKDDDIHTLMEHHAIQMKNSFSNYDTSLSEHSSWQQAGTWV